MAKGYYSSGNNAEKLYSDIYENNPTLKIKKRQKKDRKSRTIVLMGVLIVAVLCGFVAHRNAQITELHYEISEIQKNYIGLQKENETLKAENEGNIDLTEISREATKYGLQIPGNNQKISISIPKEDFVEIPLKKDVGIFEKTVTGIGDFFDFLF